MNRKYRLKIYPPCVGIRPFCTFTRRVPPIPDIFDDDDGPPVGIDEPLRLRLPLDRVGRCVAVIFVKVNGGY